ncbi:hypothetical protein [Nostoc sp. PCC 7107]|uniref:hypothetical protein n=1 Tax=Nostoc sp. PCC 7107 TaxID=317936 RepID=UPI00029EE8EB|nr:hypothetical protein [Nostoc sp. PCC 7107]AFY45314.1 hypothetical protein Nos7107_4795 [Nostoc sp. PCC 7107]
MDQIITILLQGLTIISTGALSKVGENITDHTANLAKSFVALLSRKSPDSQTENLLTTGQKIDYQQAVIDLEPIVSDPADPEVVKLLEEIRTFLSNDRKPVAVVDLYELMTQSNSQNIQVGAKDLEAEELDAEVDQTISPSDPGKTNSQTVLERVEIIGKVKLKSNQIIY